MDTDRLATLLFLMVLTESTANALATTLPSTLNTTDSDPVPADTTVAQSDNVSETVTASFTHQVTDNPALNTSSASPTSTKSAPNSTVSAVDSTSSSSESTNSSETQNEASIISTALPTTKTADNVTEIAKQTTDKSGDITEDISTAHESGESSTGADSTASTVESTFHPAYDGWMPAFLRTHHLEGQYYYDEGKYLFDFVARNVHPLSSRTLVAFFYDEDGAILEMNGTSQDGHTIQFVLDKIYTAGYRFPADMEFELVGTLVASIEVTSFDGNITKPINSSFQTFHMNKGLGVVETGDAAGTRTAIIVVIPISIAFLGIIGTVTVLCWASKKGLLRGRHRSYQLFPDTPVIFDSEAETIHI